MRLRTALMAAVLYALSPSIVSAQEADDDTDQSVQDDGDDGASAAAPAKHRRKPGHAGTGAAEDGRPTRPADGVPARSGGVAPGGPAAAGGAGPGGQPKGVVPVTVQLVETPKPGSKKEPAAPAPAPPAPHDSKTSAAAQLEPQRAVNIVTEAQLKESIEARARDLRNRDQAGADAELVTIMDARRQLGARNVVLASAELIHEATAEQQRGHADKAVKLAEAAATLSPDLASAHWLRFKLYAQRNWTQFDRVIGALGDLWHAKTSRFRNLVVLLSNVLGTLGIALFATIFTFTVIQLAKYVRYAAFDLVRILPSWLSGGETAMVLAIAIATPLVFGYGIALTLVASLVVVYAYQARGERWISNVSMVLLGAAPGFLYVCAPLVTFHGSLVDAMEAAATEAFATEAEQKLVEYQKTAGGAHDPLASLVLAMRYRMRGDLVAAESVYRQALVSQPQDAVARNNLGTLLYLLGREEQAKATFQQAGNAGTRAEPLLNYASILLDSSNFDEANLAIERARHINRELTEAYTRANTGNVPTSKKLMDADMGDASLWGKLFDLDAEQRARVMAEIWRLIGGETPPLAMPGVVLLALALASFFRSRSDQMRLSVACPKCGVPASRDAPAMYCEQCQSIFLKGVAVEPMLRLAKEAEVRNHQQMRRWLERLLSLCAGAGHIFSDSPLIGISLLFAFFLTVANMIWTDGLIVHPWSLGRDASAAPAQLVFTGIVAAILVLASVRHAFR